LLAGLVACVVCSLSLAARQESQPQPAAQQAPGHESPRERWARMSPQEREVMQQRFEQFKRMDEAQRGEVIERWKHVQRLERGTREALHGELSKLEPEQQRECLRGYVGRELFERGRAMREMLPRDLLEKIESATPQEAERLLHEFKERIRAERPDRALFELGRELQLDPAEIERLKSLPEEQRRSEMFVLRRRQIEQRVAQDGLPSWMTQQEWDELSALDAPKFCERWWARKCQLGLSSHEQRFDSRRGEWGGEHNGDHNGDRGGEHNGERDHNRERDGEHHFGGRGDGDPRGDKGIDPSLPRPSPERVHEVLEQLRPDPKWFVELSKLAPEERRAAIESRLRERLLEVLGRSPDLATPQEVEALRALQGHDFFEAIHQRMRALGIGLPPPRGMPPPPDGRGPPEGGQSPGRPPHDRPPPPPHQG
jgi:hypothetical protein